MFHNKPRDIEWSTETFEASFEGEFNADYWRSRFGIPQDKIVISYGNNTVPHHLHGPAFKVSDGLAPVLRDKTIFVFPMMYPGTEYRGQMARLLQAVSFNDLMADSQLGEGDFAGLRVVTDITINMPTSDQLSRFVLESLYAGCVFIACACLPYKALWDAGVFALRINEFEHLEGTLGQAIDNLEAVKVQSQVNRALI